MAKKFYITAAIPYVNAKPHIGHALEFVQTDTIARYHRIEGEEVKTLSGGDENALKNVQAAEKANKPTQEFVDENTQLFFELTKKLNCQFDIWQKGSNKEKHFVSSQKLWSLCFENGDIYKKTYEGLYCVGCEAFYEANELNENGECFEHPGKPLEKILEENYFFKLSKYENEIKKRIEEDTIKIYPSSRKNEVLSFLSKGLSDISISRSNARAKNWGVPVPNDETQRMYVWFDALNIYQSGIGFGWDEKTYEKYWPADLHVIGKGILRFHAIYWPAFLLSAKLAVPKAILVHDYFTVNGQKMSKTLGNVIDPIEMIAKYGVDAVRYYVLAKFSPFTDGDFSEEKLKDAYNGDLANGIGNLVARVAAMSAKIKLSGNNQEEKGMSTKVKEAIESFEFNKALEKIWNDIHKYDKTINETEVWKQNETKQKEILLPIIETIQQIESDLRVFLPETAEKIHKIFSGTEIQSGTILFPRLK
jgi:methionyl-tRNA synthetase